jgi:transcription termination factor NusB
MNNNEMKLDDDNNNNNSKKFKRSAEDIEDVDEDAGVNSDIRKEKRGRYDEDEKQGNDYEMSEDKSEGETEGKTEGEMSDDEEKGHEGETEGKMSIDEPDEVATIKRKLLDLTPVCLQKTDTIFNTLLFMCLDQGHDFRAGDSRTTTNDGQSTWVDYDFFVNKKICYLNKIKQQKFNTEYIGKSTLNSEQIFGQNDFIKGLLNTTFVGGNGAYGLVVVEDSNLSELRDDPKSLIASKIREKITIRLKLTNSYYYIYSDNDTVGDEGLTISINESTNILFLPFYPRVYNNGMHKLWSFNTKKHIYIIKLENITMVEEHGIYTLKDPNFTCEEFTIIDLIVPEYKLDFTEFYNTNFTKKDKKNLEQFTQNNEDLVKNQFFSKLFSISTITSPIPHDKVQFLDGKFVHQPSSSSIENNVPRGVKYNFQDCQIKGGMFNPFLKLLYKYQKPFIHPDYKVSGIEQSRSDILSKLLTDDSSYLDSYNAIKNREEGATVDPNIFILKQYGFITDTNIGSGSAASTADVLIDKFNNLPDTTNCVISGGMVGGELDGETKKKCDNLNQSSQTAFNRAYDSFKKYINKNPSKCSEACEYVKSNYTSILENFKKLDDFNTFCEKCQTSLPMDSLPMDTVESVSKVPHSAVPVSFTRPMDISEGVTTGETTTTSIPLETTTTTPSTIETTTPPLTGSKKEIISFNNLSDTDKVFDLTLSEPTDPFYKINSKSSTTDFDNYINNYSNDLQLYYDYIPQNKTSGIENNYFNSCWSSSIFYQQPQQFGGSNYPFKFTVASGQLDSSSLGGQSIPQYHPPEIDIYMTIFDTHGDGELKGIIVRMVFVKEVLVNSINSKSQAIVFCHFVYVDFERTKIVKPLNISQYPQKIGELLRFAVENTQYIKEDSRCINLYELKEKENLNTLDDIDFVLNFPQEGGSTVSRNWYKYFTYSQGPTVQKSIVFPTDYSSIYGLKKQASSDYVATGIINVAENLIKNSSQLRIAFNVTSDERSIDDDPNFLFFIKLFLIRNKYTGDKSRSTDTLFLDQTKYLEGVQISNDENTLYNAQMFGLNTVWSTKTQSIFYMTPYLTPSGQVPITFGSYVTALCEGLKSNPNLVSSSTGKESVVAITDDEAEDINEFKREILSTLDMDNIPESVKKYFNFIDNRTILEYWSKGYYELKELYSFLNKFKDESLDQLDTGIKQYIKSCSEAGGDQNKLKKITDNFEKVFVNPETQKLKDYFDEFKDIFDLIVEQKDDLYKTISNMATEVTEKAKLNNLFNTILLLSKTFPWWLDMILKDIKIKFYNELCDKCISFLDKMNELLSNTEIGYCQQFRIYKKILSDKKYFEDNISDIICFNINDNSDKKLTSLSICPKKDQPEIKPFSITRVPLTETPDIYLKPLNPQEIEDLDKEAQIKAIELNDTKFSNVSVDFLELLKRVSQVSTNLSDLTPAEKQSIYALERATTIKKKQVPSIKFERKPGFVPVGQTVVQPEPKDVQSKYEEVGTPTAAAMEEDTLGGAPPTSTLTPEQLTTFYNNSYKCNIGNYLKSFINIINTINSEYNDLSINYNKDNGKELLIKILLLYIELVNKSFIPNIKSNDIISVIEKVDISYSTEKMNTIINTYSTQLNTYMIINSLMNTEEISNIDLINILNSSISNNIYNSLDLPFSIFLLKNKIMSQDIYTGETKTSEIEEPEETSETKEPLKQDQKPLKPSPIDYTKLYPNQSMFSTFNQQAISAAAGGMSIKNKKNNKFLKTKNNKSTIKRRKTIKRRNIKRKNYTRKN